MVTVYRMRPPSLTIVDVNRVVESVAQRISDSAPDLCVIRSLDGTIPEVRTDADRLAHLLSKLAEAMAPPQRATQVTLRTDRVCRDVHVTVIGRVDKTAFARCLEEAANTLHRLSVRVKGPDPTPDGLRLTLCIPAVPTDLSAAARSLERSTVPNNRVLLVDDEALFRSAHDRLLRMNGFDVLAADSGPAALSLFASHRGEIEWVLTDIRMPGMAGTTLFERLRSEDPNLKIIVMTGFAADDVVDRVRAQGAYAVLTKPFDADELIGLLRGLLRPPTSESQP